MKSGIATTGITGNTYKALFRKQIMGVRPSAVGLAVAYVSVSGFSLVKKILDDGGVDEIRLVTDTRDRVTHPKALHSAVDSGWNVRVVDSLAGTFHPKLYVGGAGFDESASMVDLSLAITGSANLSHGGFFKNGECVFWNATLHGRKSAAKAWLDCWNAGVPATAETLATYEKYFALRNRYRKAEDMVALGIADSLPEKVDGAPTKKVTPPRKDDKAISDAVATVAWAGLQSFTGAYTLQVEFPREAGRVLLRIFGDLSQEDTLDIRCSDNEIRTFRYRFYEDNGMFRLNIPNSTPLVAWAREHKQGIASVEYDEAEAALNFEIVRPGQNLMEMVDRSLALGTWGRTPTRLYGWF